MKHFSWLKHATHATRAKIIAGGVALACFIISFSHIYALAYSVGESKLAAILIALVIDGSVLTGIFTGLAAAAKGKARGFWSWLALWLGGIATVSANLASSENNVTAKLVSVVAPVFLVITIEVLTYLTSRVEEPEPEPEPVKPQSAAQFVRENPNASVAAIVEAKGVTPRHAQRLLDQFGSRSD